MKALKLLIQEQDSLAKNDNDIGEIWDLNMSINVKDNVPIQKNYLAVPKPLYDEVKAHIEDLLNKKFIQKSSSPYSSSKVCVRKKDGSLQLCVDYRALNAKSLSERHPYLEFRKHWIT